MGPTIADAMAAGRDNHFNLIRICAAYCVLVSHSYALVTGSPENEPLRSALGFSLGTLAVWVFFGVSGFLVAQSWWRSANAADFALARVLRIFPGLIVAVVLAALVLGPACAQIPLRSYFSDLSWASYIGRNITLFSPQYTLPGLFEHNPYPNTVNGSLWTLMYEVTCYAALALSALCGSLRRPLVGAAFAVSFLMLWSLAIPQPEHVHVPGRVGIFLTFGLPFLFGAAAFTSRAYVRLRLIYVVTGWALCYGLRSTFLFDPAFMLATTYTVLCLAYTRITPLLRYNAFGDYSYGVYIYAFPVQQTVIHLLPSLTPARHILLSAATVLPLAILSWHCVERPALRCRGKRRNQAEIAPQLLDVPGLPDVTQRRPMLPPALGATLK